MEIAAYKTVRVRVRARVRVRVRVMFLDRLKLGMHIIRSVVQPFDDLHRGTDVSHPL